MTLHLGEESTKNHARSTGNTAALKNQAAQGAILNHLNMNSAWTLGTTGLLDFVLYLIFVINNYVCESCPVII